MCIGPTPTVHVTMDVYVYVSSQKFLKPTGNLGRKALQQPVYQTTPRGSAQQPMYQGECVLLMALTHRESAHRACILVLQIASRTMHDEMHGRAHGEMHGEMHVQMHVHISRC